MQIQRPPRGQAWPKGRSLPWIRRFQLIFFPYFEFFIHFVHLLVIRQCPSGTEFGDNVVQFHFFSVHSFFQRTSGLRLKKYIEFQFISVSILWGRAPQNLLTDLFLIFGKNSKSKKIEKIFFDFGSKNYADRCNLVSGVRQKSFFVQK